ncbi:hypothetical protein M5D96_006453, partial [Drosophila gunungcola]
ISVTEDTVLTWEELHMNAKRVAVYMRNLGLEQGDFVGVIGRLTTHMTAVAYACFFNGTPYHALHTEFGDKPKLIFCDGDEFEKVRAATEDLQVQIITMRNHPEGSLRIQDILRTPVGQNFQPVRLNEGSEQTLALLSSSGTSGPPKALFLKMGELNAGITPLETECTYDDDLKTWSGGERQSLFSADLSIGEIIFHEMERHPKLIAQVRAASQGHQVKIVTMRNHPRCDSIRIQDVLTTPVEPNFRPVRLTLGTDQTLAILSSSGTTGVPKAVTISNSHQIIVTFLNMNNSIVQYTSSTLDWFSGLVMNITAGVFSTTNIIADGDFDPALLCNIIRQYKISLVLLSSSYIAMLANCPEFKTADLSSLKNLFYGGSNCSLDVQKRARSRLSHDCLNFSYTLTELNSAGCVNFNFDLKPNSVGRPVRGIKVKVIDTEGKAQGPNNVGEICFYSGQKWYGYYESPEETRLIQDSQKWFHTGDLGYVDEDGYVFIIDRIKDMLKYQNIMYYPSEIENVIAEMPDVVEACVFGIWDEVNGDEAAASVVKKQGSELKSQDVVDYVRKRISAKYKQLNGGALIVDQITGIGDRKTNRAAAKAHFLKHMNNN